MQALLSQRFRHTLVLISCALAVALSDVRCVLAADNPKQPNIVYILADDLGWTDVGCQGSKYYETPHIDKLAKRGLRLTSFYHYQNCAPTRASLMSGQYTPRHGILTVNTLERGNAQYRKMIPPPNETKLPRFA